MYNILSTLYLSDITAFANGLIILFKDYSSTAGVNNNSTSARQLAFYLYFVISHCLHAIKLRLIKVTFVVSREKQSFDIQSHFTIFSWAKDYNIF